MSTLGVIKRLLVASVLSNDVLLSVVFLGSLGIGHLGT